MFLKMHIKVTKRDVKFQYVYDCSLLSASKLWSDFNQQHFVVNFYFQCGILILTDSLEALSMNTMIELDSNQEYRMIRKSHVKRRL